MRQLEERFNTKNKKLSLYRFSLPFNKPISFKEQRLSSREGLWLIDHQPDGHDFIGEICPLPGFSQETLNQCEQQILQRLQQTSNDDFSTNALLPSVSFSLFCLQQKLPWQTPVIELPPQLTLPNIPLLQGTPVEIIDRYKRLFCPAQVKLKVARLPVDQEIALLHNIIGLNPKIRFRLDANQQWRAKQYIQFLKCINSQYIDYIEEPTDSLSDNLEISEQFKVMIALDESLLTQVELPCHKVIKALVIKPTLIGYPSRINTLLLHAQQQQLSVSISASFESPIGLNQLQQLSQQWQQDTNLSISLGLDTLQAFDQEIIEAAKHSTNLKDTLLTQATCLWRS